MSCHNPGIRKSAVFRLCVLVDVREERISGHDVKRSATTMIDKDKPG